MYRWGDRRTGSVGPLVTEVEDGGDEIGENRLGEVGDGWRRRTKLLGLDSGDGMRRRDAGCIITVADSAAEKTTREKLREREKALRRGERERRERRWVERHVLDSTFYSGYKAN
ncbi:C-repeat/DRE binding factor 1 [Striga asiatica]|uniref:C-repeat/DRE binding factor 1 n=1 Tax=Striga asiatica TaxID=4170 RepID=A0A5A7QFH9_STRAF|nr:C-repeat/DRE binding factor 1 [Striga asiatica]